MKYFSTSKAGTSHIGYQQQVKETNIKHIFDLVRSGKCKSRAEIVRQMDLSATSVSVLVEELAHRKLIDETGPTQTSLPGRRPISLRLNKTAHHIAVFSVTTRGVRFALMNLECHILEDLFVPLDPATLTEENQSDAYIEVFDDILRNRSRRFNPSRAMVIGISFPGIYFEPDKLFHTRQSIGFDLPEEPVRRFQHRVGLPVYLLNNTRCMAYAEKKHLDRVEPDGPENQDMLFVRVHERINSGLISGGDLYFGPFNVSGEIGHSTINFQGKPCRCGNRGCLEQYANLSAILESAREAAREAGIELPESLEALADRYPGEPALLESVKRSAQLLSYGLYSVMCSAGIRHIVLGGGIEILGDIFLQEVYNALMSRSLLIRHVILTYAQAGPDAEILGLAEHFLDKVFSITM